MPDCVRVFNAGLQVMSRTSPILVASSANRRAIATCGRQNFQQRKKTRFSPSSHICPRRFLHDLSIHVGHSCPEPKSIIMLLSKLTCPSRVTRPLARLPAAYAATFKYLSLPPQAPRLAAGQQHNSRRSRKMWGGGACDDRGPTFCLRRSPPQEPPEENAPPAQRGPRRERKRTSSPR